MRRIFADRMRELLFTGLVAGSPTLVSRYLYPLETADPLASAVRFEGKEK